VILKTYPSVTKPSKQARGSGIRDYSREKGIYTPLSVGQQACIHDCQGKKGRICFKTRLGKGKRLKTQTQSEQNLSSSDTTRNTKEKEQGKTKKVLQPLEGRSLPSGVAISVTREKLSMAKGKPQ
jgi:hypothetical protein